MEEIFFRNPKPMFERRGRACLRHSSEKTSLGADQRRNKGETKGQVRIRLRNFAEKKTRV